jgi:antitoxin StbD
METIFADKTVSVTELKRNLASVIQEAGNDAVAILNHNKPEAYLLSAPHYERLLERLEDLEDAELIKKRGDGPFVKVRIDEL